LRESKDQHFSLSDSGKQVFGQLEPKYNNDSLHPVIQQCCLTNATVPEILVGYEPTTTTIIIIRCKSCWNKIMKFKCIYL